MEDHVHSILAKTRLSPHQRSRRRHLRLGQRDQPGHGVGEPLRSRVPQLAAGVLRGEDSALTEAERAMAAWARRVTRNPNGTSTEDVQELRDAGWALTSLGRQRLVPFPQAVSPLPPMRAAVLLPQDLPGADAALHAE